MSTIYKLVRDADGSESYVCVECDRETSYCPEDVEAHFGREHAVRATRKSAEGMEAFRFEAEEHAKAYVEVQPRQKDGNRLHWEGPGWYVWQVEHGHERDGSPRVVDVLMTFARVLDGWKKERKKHDDAITVLLRKQALLREFAASCWGQWR